MNWELNEIKIGDAVRVNMGHYYHYGICTAEDRIVQFGLPIINSNPSEVKVCATDIKTFLYGKFAEVLVFNKKELKKRNPINVIIEKAENSIGEGGYNILHNNCEHFMNRCIFNENKSNQVIDVQKQMKELISAKVVYVAPIQNFSNQEVLPKYANNELLKITNQNIKNQKIAAYGLLKYAVKDFYKREEDFKTFRKTKNGKPVTEGYCFSVSHTKDLVAVGVSDCNLGVDLQDVDITKNPILLKNSMIAPGEDIQENLNHIISIWTKKEAIFKFKGEKKFNPKKINTDLISAKTFEFNYNNITYFLSVSSCDINNVKIIKLF